MYSAITEVWCEYTLISGYRPAALTLGELLTISPSVGCKTNRFKWFAGTFLNVCKNNKYFMHQFILMEFFVNNQQYKNDTSNNDYFVYQKS